MTLLSGDQRRRLLRVARAALVARVREARPEPTVSQSEMPPSGAFVTLRIGQTLRGCVGQVEGTGSLVDTISHVAAATNRRRRRTMPSLATR